MAATLFDGEQGADSDWGNLMQIILPEGKLPADLQWTYNLQPGLEGGATFEVDAPLIRRLQALLMYDSTSLLLTAPTGFGILTDPTTLQVDATLLAAALIAETEVFTGDAIGFDWRVFVGAGLTAYRSETRMRAKSVFLDIDESTVEHRLTPIGALTIEARRERAIGSIAVRVFPTDAFATASVSMRLGMAF